MGNNKPFTALSSHGSNKPRWDTNNTRVTFKKKENAIYVTP